MLVEMGQERIMTNRSREFSVLQRLREINNYHNCGSRSRFCCGEASLAWFQALNLFCEGVRKNANFQLSINTILPLFTELI